MNTGVFLSTFKVETIGDAYMVVGGVPENTPDHAQRIANQGMDMVLKAGEVRSPASGKALQVSKNNVNLFDQTCPDKNP